MAEKKPGAKKPKINHDAVFTIELDSDNGELKEMLSKSVREAVFKVSKKFPDVTVKLWHVPFIISSERIELL
jgi:hypothetical protein